MNKIDEIKNRFLKQDKGESEVEAQEVEPDEETLEQWFKDELAAAVLKKADLNWRDFDITAFLSVFEGSELHQLCRSIEVYMIESKGKHCAQTKRIRVSEYELKNDIANAVLDTLGVPLAEFDIPAFRSSFRFLVNNSTRNIREDVRKSNTSNTVNGSTENVALNTASQNSELVRARNLERERRTHRPADIVQPNLNREERSLEADMSGFKLEELERPSTAERFPSKDVRLNEEANELRGKHVRKAESSGDATKPREDVKSEKEDVEERNVSEPDKAVKVSVGVAVSHAVSSVGLNEALLNEENDYETDAPDPEFIADIDEVDLFYVDENQALFDLGRDESLSVDELTQTAVQVDVNSGVESVSEEVGENIESPVEPKTASSAVEKSDSEIDSVSVKYSEAKKEVVEDTTTPPVIVFNSLGSAYQTKRRKQS